MTTRCHLGSLIGLYIRWGKSTGTSDTNRINEEIWIQILLHRSIASTLKYLSVMILLFTEADVLLSIHVKIFRNNLAWCHNHCSNGSAKHVHVEKVIKCGRTLTQVKVTWMCLILFLQLIRRFKYFQNKKLMY